MTSKKAYQEMYHKCMEVSKVNKSLNIQVADLLKDKEESRKKISNLKSQVNEKKEKLI